MDDRPLSILHYLPVSPRDEQWGIVCTTAGHQHVPPGTPLPRLGTPRALPVLQRQRPHARRIPAGLHHRRTGTFRVGILPVADGRGGHHAPALPQRMALLFARPRHRMDGVVGRLPRRQYRPPGAAGVPLPPAPLLRIGCSGGIERCYREIIGTVEEERVGFQPLISSIVLHILGSVLFKHSNLLYSDNPVVEKINRAKAIMRTDFGRNRSPEQIAREVGMGYVVPPRLPRIRGDGAGAIPAHDAAQQGPGTARDDSPQHLGNSLCARLRKRERLLALFPPPRTAQSQSVPRPLPGREGAVTRRGRPRQQPAGTGQSRDAPRAAQGSDTRGATTRRRPKH